MCIIKAFQIEVTLDTALPISVVNWVEIGECEIRTRENPRIVLLLMTFHKDWNLCPRQSNSLHITS